MESKTYTYQNSNRLKDTRRFLRAHATTAEKILWKHLRNNQLGFKFRRQFSVKNVIADFYCHEPMLIIELDGWTHDSEITKLKDARKQKMLEVSGYKVIRFTNEQVYGDIGKIIDAIKSVCNERSFRIPHPLSLP